MDNQYVFPAFYTDELRLIEYATKNGISWFDLMYPRGSEKLDRELKVGKYTPQSVVELTRQCETRLSGYKRRRN